MWGTGSAAGCEREHALSSVPAVSAAVGKQALSVALVVVIVTLDVVVVAVIPSATDAAGAVRVLVTWPLYRWHVIC